jgi:hypothetical protein
VLAILTFRLTCGGSTLPYDWQLAKSFRRPSSPNITLGAHGKDGHGIFRLVNGDLG